METPLIRVTDNRAVYAVHKAWHTESGEDFMGVMLAMVDRIGLPMTGELIYQTYKGKPTGEHYGTDTK